MFEGQLALRTRISNPGPKARTVSVDLAIESSDMPSLEDQKKLQVPAGETRTYRYKVSSGRLHEKAKHEAHLAVRSKGREAPLLDWRARWTKAAKKAWPGVKTGPEPKKAVKLAYFPSYQFVRVSIDRRFLGKKSEKAKKARVVVTGGKGEKHLERTLQVEGKQTQGQFEIGALEDGSYTAKITLEGGGYERTFERRFRRKHFVWEGNDLGKTEKVYAPFEPVDVEGDTVSVVMRDYELGPLGFFKALRVENNEGSAKQLLAAPSRLIANGRDLAGEGQFAKTGKQQAIHEGRASSPAVTVETRTITEYDGCHRVEMTLKPGTGDKKLEQLTLEIPIKDKHAPLFHVSSTTLRRNPAGATPAGSGRVWDSRDYPDGEWVGNFKPYLWVGGPERGLSFFADNDKNWALQLGKKKGQKEKPCQALVREDGVLKLRVHFVQRPIEVKEPRKIVFGLMASPAKPMPENWRNILYYSQWARAGKLPGYRTLSWFGSTYWGAREGMAETYPVGRDFSILSKMQEVRLTGEMAGVKAFMKAWSDRHLRGDWPESGRNLRTKKQTRKLARLSIRRMRRQPDFLTVYWEEFHGVSKNHPETQIFGNEWSGGFQKGSVHALAKSYRDFQAWYGAEFVRRGIGLYFDNTFPKRATDPATTAAYRRPSGRIQPSANMWRHRKYLKRIWVLHQELTPPRKKPIMMFHMTNTHILPYMGFGQTNLDLEWRYSKDKPFQARYSPELLRAESLGLQTGNVPFALAHENGAPGRVAGAMVHEIRVGRPQGEARNARLKRMLAFGYGRGADVVNYWDEDGKLTVSDERCKWLLLKNGRKRMLLLCTWNPEKRRVRIEAAEPVAKLEDVESGRALKADGAAFRVKMPGYGVRLLRWRAGGP